MRLRDLPTFIGLGLGLIIGTFFKPTASLLGFAGDLYTRAVDLVIVPMLVVLIATSIAAMRDSRVGRRLTWPTFGAIGIAVAVAGSAPLFTGMMLDVGGRLPPSARVALGQYVRASEAAVALPLFAADDAPRADQLDELLHQFIPANAFEALKAGERTQLVLFAIVFGAGLSIASLRARESVVEVLEQVYRSFEGILHALVVALPVGLMCNVAREVSEVDPSSVLAMLPFTSLGLVLFALTAALAVAGVARMGRASVRDAFFTLGKPMAIAFTALEADAGVPAAVEGMRILRYHRAASDVVTPLTIAVAKLASIAYVALAVSFAATIYHVHLGPGAFFAAVAGSIAAGVAAPSEGYGGVVLIGGVLDLAGIPAGAIMILLAVIDPIVTPFRAAANVAAGMFLATLVLPRPHARRPRPRTEEGHEERRTDPGPTNLLADINGQAPPIVEREGMSALRMPAA